MPTNSPLHLEISKDQPNDTIQSSQCESTRCDSKILWDVPQERGTTKMMKNPTVTGRASLLLGVLDRILQDENHICVGVISRTLLQRTNKAMLRCVGWQQVFSWLGLDGPGMIWLMIKCSCQFHVGCVDAYHIMFWFWVFFWGSTIRALLHGKINPKDWQVFSPGDVNVGFLLIF